MKGQQLFHSFLPGVTAAVLTTQPAWAGTVKVGGVQLASSPSVLTSLDGRTLAGDTMNTQLRNSESDRTSALVPAPGLTKLGVEPSRYQSVPELATGYTVVPIEQISRKDEGRFSTLPTTSNAFHLPDGSRFIQSSQKQDNSASSGHKLEISPAIPASVQTETLLLSSSQQPAVQKKNPHNQLQTVLPTSATGAGASCLQDGRKSQTVRSASLLLNSSICSQKHVNIAQSNTSTPSETITPAPTGSVPIPENLNPSANPLQFPTKPEEVTLQGNQPLTLGQALELAKRNNRDLQVSILQLERSRSALREAEAGLYPTVSLNGDITRQQSAGGQLGVELQEQQPDNPFSRASDQPSTAFSASAQLSYDLYTSGANAARIGAASEQVRASELDVERQSEEIRLNVATDYYNLQQADQQVRISQSAVQNAQASLRDAEALERAGVGTRFDVLRSQVNLANSQQELTNALSQQQTSRRQLATRINLSQSVNISAADPVQLAGLWNQTLEQSIVLAYQNRPELQQQLAQRNISEQRRRLALSGLGPQVSVVASYNLLDEFDDGVSVTDGYSLALRASLNLFDGGAARARADQEKANIAIAETQFAEQRNQVRFQVEQAFYTQQSNLDNVQTSNVALEQAREALRLARLRFQAGVGTQTDVINSENDLTVAEGNRVRAILDYNRALTQLQRYVTLRGLSR